MGRDLACSRAFGAVKVASISTSEEQRDAHLRSADFFGVDNYPVITFASTRAEAIDGESSQVFGNLTMPGVTSALKLDVVISGTDQDPWGNTRIGLDAVGVIKPSDSDMRFNQALGSGTCSSATRSACRSTSPR